MILKTIGIIIKNNITINQYFNLIRKHVSKIRIFIINMHSL